MKIDICYRHNKPEGEAAQVKGQWSGSFTEAYYLMVEVIKVRLQSRFNSLDNS
jgi:hypothetical protein